MYIMVCYNIGGVAAPRGAREMARRAYFVARGEDFVAITYSIHVYIIL